MKKYVLTLLCVFLTGIAFAGSFSAGRKKVCVYDCPDGYEYVIHTPGDSYSHTCADNSVMNNPSTTVEKKMEYDTTTGFDNDDILAIVTGETPSDAALEKINDDAISYAEDFIEARDNAPEPEAPSVDDVKNMVDSNLDVVKTLIDQLGETEATESDFYDVKEKCEEAVEKVKEVGNISSAEIYE